MSSLVLIVMLEALLQLLSRNGFLLLIIQYIFSLQTCYLQRHYL